MEKGPDAFRTISEVAEDLDLPQHVLRFWETRFPQIRPLKRGGGRRYYRPDDVELLRGIRHLLYAEGYTIRGVQRILKEDGPRHVQAIWQAIEGGDAAGGGTAGGRAARTDDDDSTDDIADDDSTGDDMAGDDLGEAGGRARGREGAAPARGGALSGLLNLLPSRQHGGAAEEGVTVRRVGRHPLDDEPEFPELPLLPEIAPREERHLREPGRREPSLYEPHLQEPHLHPPGLPEGRRAEPQVGPPPFGEARPSFAFRPLAPEREPGVDDESDDDRPARPGIDQQADEDDGYGRPPARGERPPSRDEPALHAAEPLLAVSRTQLTADDIRRLLLTFQELRECRRILEAARDEGGFPMDEGN
ncbi:DNA-binding transcriptional MerR regulator [Angulomicrobium tetraedrale]|uniref:DNA-binding transcriptional MerR regulator n=1 Tax=Ancylobacter tetraedralis TaxID=217068 RepID=A0A839ZE09_9HYPH|nr:DNA-binding transcriptional MerR regulator [Ancylobacter tetraedralis]